MTTHATPTTTAIIPATGTASNRINPKSARTAPRTIMRIPQTLYVFAEYSFFCGAFVELDAAGFPFAAVNPFAMSDAETLKEMTTVNDDVSKLATGDNEQGTPQENAEDDENASNEDKATNPPTEQENGENGANTEPDKATEEQQEDKVIIPQGKMRVTVICDGSLNIRRSAAWGNDNICGRAIRGQSYYVKEIHVVDGKKMVRTIGDLYLSGESEHVQFEQL